MQQVARVVQTTKAHEVFTFMYFPVELLTRVRSHSTLILLRMSFIVT